MRTRMQVTIWAIGLTLLTSSAWAESLSENGSAADYTRAKTILVGSPVLKSVTPNWGTLFYYEPGKQTLSRMDLSVKSTYGTLRFHPTPPKSRSVRFWLSGETMWIDNSDAPQVRGFWFKEKDEINLAQLCFGPDVVLADFLESFKPEYSIVYRLADWPVDGFTFRGADMDIPGFIHFLKFDDVSSEQSKLNKLMEQIKAISRQIDYLEQLVKAAKEFVADRSCWFKDTARLWAALDLDPKDYKLSQGELSLVEEVKQAVSVYNGAKRAMSDYERRHNADWRVYERRQRKEAIEFSERRFSRALARVEELTREKVRQGKKLVEEGEKLAKFIEILKDGKAVVALFRKTEFLLEEYRFHSQK